MLRNPCTPSQTPHLALHPPHPCTRHLLRAARAPVPPRRAAPRRTAPPPGPHDTRRAAFAQASAKRERERADQVMTLQDNIEEIQNHLASGPACWTRHAPACQPPCGHGCACGHPPLQKPSCLLRARPSGPKRSARAAWRPRRGCGGALPPAPRHRRRRLLTSQAISSPRTRRWAARTSPPTGCGPTTTRACPSSSSRRRTCMHHTACACVHVHVHVHVHACVGAVCGAPVRCAVCGGVCMPRP